MDSMLLALVGAGLGGLSVGLSVISIACSSTRRHWRQCVQIQCETLDAMTRTIASLVQTLDNYEQRLHALERGVGAP